MGLLSRRRASTSEDQTCGMCGLAMPIDDDGYCALGHFVGQASSLGTRQRTSRIDDPQASESVLDETAPLPHALTHVPTPDTAGHETETVALPPLPANEADDGYQPAAPEDEKPDDLLAALDEAGAHAPRSAQATGHDPVGVPPDPPQPQRWEPSDPASRWQPGDPAPASQPEQGPSFLDVPDEEPAASAAAVAPTDDGNDPWKPVGPVWEPDTAFDDEFASPYDDASPDTGGDSIPWTRDRPYLASVDGEDVAAPSALDVAADDLATPTPSAAAPTPEPQRQRFDPEDDEAAQEREARRRAIGMFGGGVATLAVTAAAFGGLLL